MALNPISYPNSSQTMATKNFCDSIQQVLIRLEGGSDDRDIERKF